MLDVSECGKQEAPVVLLINGINGLFNESNLSFRKIEENFHIIMPTMAESKSAIESAHEISQFINRNYHGEIYAICSTWDNWNVTKELLADNTVTSEKMVVEAAGTAAGSLFAAALME